MKLIFGMPSQARGVMRVTATHRETQCLRQLHVLYVASRDSQTSVNAYWHIELLKCSDFAHAFPMVENARTVFMSNPEGISVSHKILFYAIWPVSVFFSSK